MTEQLKIIAAIFILCLSAEAPADTIVSTPEASDANTLPYKNKHRESTMTPSTPQPRVTPLSPADWDQDILDALGAFPSSLNFVYSKWQENSDDHRGRAILGFLAHYPQLAKSFLTLNKHVAVDTLLSTRDKELIILRTTWLRRADNEFAQHIILGKRAGLESDDIERVIKGPNAAGWQNNDATLVQAVDDLVEQDRVRPVTMTALSKSYSDKEIMDMIFLVGNYSVLGSAVNSFDIPLDPGLEKHDPQIGEFLNHWRHQRD